MAQPTGSLGRKFAITVPSPPPGPGSPSLGSTPCDLLAHKSSWWKGILSYLLLTFEGTFVSRSQSEFG